MTNGERMEGLHQQLAEPKSGEFKVSLVPPSASSDRTPLVLWVVVLMALRVVAYSRQVEGHALTGDEWCATVDELELGLVVKGLQPETETAARRVLERARELEGSDSLSA